MSKTHRLDNLVRKLRKKLRQIENLERLNRPLTGEECIKLNSKDEVREQLQDTLDEYQGNDENNSGLVPGGEGYDPLSDRQEALHNHSQAIEQRKEETSLTPERTKSKNHASKHNEGDVKKQEAKVKKTRPQLSESYCRVSYLEGHNDLVTALVALGDKLITASRDTTLKYWDITQKSEIHSFGGHSGAVTCLLVLEHADEAILPENDKLLVSGSVDSTFKLWALQGGHLIKSVYTYSPITQVAYCHSESRLITGSDGGKLELWNLMTGENRFSSLVHDGSVTGLKVSKSTVYSSSSSGVIKVHQVIGNGEDLTCLFVAESLKTSSNDPLITRHIRCMALGQEVLFYGDDAKNIKMLDWKKGLVRKLTNHINSFTSTDSLSCHDDFLLSSSYDLDTGLGYMNVRSSKTLEYLASLDDKNTERIVCLDFGHTSSKNLVVISGGMDLKLWEVLPNLAFNQRTAEESEEIFKLEYRSALSQPAVDSEMEPSSEDDSDTADDDDGGGRQRFRKAEQVSSNSAGWLSWCSIL